MNILGSVNFNLNQLEEATLEQLSSDPTGTGLVVGRIWINTTSNTLKFFDGTAVHTFSSLDNLNTFISQLSTVHQPNAGSNLVGIQDAGNHFSGLTTVEQALQQLGSSASSELNLISNLSNGLGSNGPAGVITYSNINYISNGDSVISALGILDQQAKINSNNIQTNLNNITTKVSNSGGELTGSLNFQSLGTVTGLTTPVNPTDAATKYYVDTSIETLTWKQPVQVLSSNNIPLLTSAPLVIDGISLNVGNRILLTGQVIGSQNGPYTVTSINTTNSTCSLTLASDILTTGDVWFVENGTTFSNTGWILTTPLPITVGTTVLSFSQFTGLSDIVATSGLIKTGNNIGISFGAGLTQLPIGSAGISLSPSGGLLLTTNGTTSNPVAGSQLAIQLNDPNLVLTSAGLALSTVFKTNVSNINTSVGLSSIGIFIPFTSTYFLNSATSISNALTILDNETQLNSTTISNSDTAIGLSSGGTFIPFTSTYFLNSATSISNALTLLDMNLSNKATTYTYVATTANTTFTITHNLGVQYVNVIVYNSSTNETVTPNSITAVNTNSITVTFESSLTPIIVINT